MERPAVFLRDTPQTLNGKFVCEVTLPRLPHAKPGHKGTHKIHFNVHILLG